MRCRELDIAEAGGEELRARIGRRPGLARALRGEEAAEALGRERGEQRAGIGEVVRWRGVADADAARDAAQREILRAALGQFLLGGAQQRRAQVAMVVGRGAAARTGRLARQGPCLGRHPDAVKFTS